MKQLQAPLAVGFLLLLAIAGASIWLYIVETYLNDEVSATLQVSSIANRLLVLVQDAETGQRGYILTHNKDYLEPYNIGSKAAPQAAQELEEAIGQNPEEKNIAAHLKGVVGAKLKELKSTLVPAANGDFGAALAVVNNNTGNNFMQDIRDDISQINLYEDRTRQIISARANRTNIFLAVSTLIAVLLVVILALYSIRAARRATDELVGVQKNLEAVNQNLENIVEARVGDLRQANEEIQRFAYIVSHDLRAPLVNVVGFTTELAALRGDLKTFLDEVESRVPELITPQIREGVETDLPEALGFIRASTAKMDRLINAILKLSREGKRTLRPEKISLAQLVGAQGESLSQQLALKDAELHVDGELPDLVSDRLAIEQIFGNLIENAVKYLMPGRAGKIAVRGKRDGPVLRYEIVDNGRGIAEKDRERVFELFRRSGEQDTQGEGIGLAYVRNLARRLGGMVSVESEFGTGSTFIVTLPAVFVAVPGAEF